MRGRRLTIEDDDKIRELCEVFHPLALGRNYVGHAYSIGVGSWLFMTFGGHEGGLRARDGIWRSIRMLDDTNLCQQACEVMKNTMTIFVSPLTLEVICQSIYIPCMIPNLSSASPNPLTRTALIQPRVSLGSLSFPSLLEPSINLNSTSPRFLSH